jgi:hypothetical protein
LNRRPSACKADALPTELHPLGRRGGERERGSCEPYRQLPLSPSPPLPLSSTSSMGVPELESGTSSLSATRSNQLSYTPAIAARPSIDQARMRAEEFTECRFALQGNLPAESARMRRILGVADRSAGFDRRRSLRRASRAAALRLRTSASSAERADGAIRSASKSTFPARDWFVRMNLVRQNESE